MPSVNGEFMASRHAHSPSLRHSEQGGVTILTTLGLLVLLTVMVFSLGKSSLRELAVTGTVWQGAKASEAAEAGLDWFILWANSDNASAATAYRRNDVVSSIQSVNAGVGTWVNGTFTASTWDRSARLTSTPTDTNTDMVFANSGAGFSQSAATTGNQVVQSFDVFFRYLGSPVTTTMSSGAGSPASIGSGQTGRNMILYQVQSTGKASIPAGGSNFIRYQTTREMYLTAAP
jgi:Tfp pilus assembly protein PilX